jgi:uncharacterized membrane protein
MESLPGIWRVELIHPMVVHLPIALLASGTGAWLAGCLVDDQGRWGFLKPAGRLALVVGTLSAWVAIYTGSLADAEVVRSLCDPTVVERHEEWAYWIGYLFTGSVLLDLGLARVEIEGPWRQAATIVVAVAFLAGTGLLGYVGHLGARLVYQQGAGVYHPSEDCSEFVE